MKKGVGEKRVCIPLAVIQWSRSGRLLHWLTRTRNPSVRILGWEWLPILGNGDLQMGERTKCLRSVNHKCTFFIRIESHFPLIQAWNYVIFRMYPSSTRFLERTASIFKRGKIEGCTTFKVK